MTMVTIKDVAREAGVSISTVSNVLNGKKNVGEDTRKQILEICEALHYTPNLAGKMLKQQVSSVIFTFSDFDRNFYLQIIKGINDFFREKDYDLLICTEKSCEKFMNPVMSKGAIVLNPMISNEHLSRIASEDYPIVVLDRTIRMPCVKSVVVNNRLSMKRLTDGLIERGYKRFAYVGGPEELDDSKERYQGFLDALQGKNLPFHRRNYFSGDWKEKSGYTAAKILTIGEALPDVLVCANDNMAEGAMAAFAESGIRVPEDIGITGFDDHAKAKDAGLSTVHIPEYERGYLAAMNLGEMLKGRYGEEPFRINAEIKWRESVLVKRTQK